MQVTLFQIVAPFGEEGTREANDLLHRHVGVQLLVLRDEADPAADIHGAGGIGDWCAKHEGVAAVGSQKAHQRFDGGGLARAVAAEETEDAPSRHPQVQAAQCRFVLERHTELARFNNEIGHGLPSATFPNRRFRTGLGQLVFKCSSKLIFGQPQQHKPLDGRLHYGSRLADHTSSSSPRLFDESSGAVLQLENPFVFQLPVRADHGIGVHDQVLGDLADSRELIALAERTCFHRVLHLLHELEVERNAGGLIQSKDHNNVY